MTAFDRAPFIATWETTRARACVHGRAEALPLRHPDDSTTEERFHSADAEAGHKSPLASPTDGLGSRARAWAAGGDPPAEDPGCAWQPAGPVAGPLPVIAGGSGPATPVTPEQVTQALRGVFDPELGMSIVELGMVYGIDVRGGAVSVTMTLTAPGCPIHDVMPRWVKEAVAGIPGVERVDVTIAFDPPWTPDRIGPRLGE